LHHNNTEAIRGVVTRYFGTGEAADKAECVLILLIAERALHTSVKKTRTNGFEGAPRPSATGCATKPFTTTPTSPRRRPTVMADYYNFQQVVQMCGIAESTLEQLQSKGLLEPTVKSGRPFLSSRQVYRLRIAVHQASEEKIDLQEALARVEERWLAQTVALRS
jgi:hypothetical protein